ncbi:hypothetical protein HG531_008339 [Fusarium graminearum]|nr:hypothetical protein HG531_008339 [Fusarium graminearum]
MGLALANSLEVVADRSSISKTASRATLCNTTDDCIHITTIRVALNLDIGAMLSEPRVEETEKNRVELSIRKVFKGQNLRDAAAEAVIVSKERLKLLLVTSKDEDPFWGTFVHLAEDNIEDLFSSMA